MQQDPNEVPITYTAAEVARKLRVSPTTVRNWMRAKPPLLPIYSQPFGGKVEILAVELDQMIAEANRRAAAQSSKPADCSCGSQPPKRGRKRTR